MAMSLKNLVGLPIVRDAIDDALDELSEDASHAEASSDVEAERLRVEQERRARDEAVAASEARKLKENSEW